MVGDHALPARMTTKKVLNSVPWISLIGIICIISTTKAQFSINQMMKGDTTTFYTDSNYGYDKYWLDIFFRNYFVFTVRACSDVHIALLRQRTDLNRNITEVVLGGWYNSRSVFRNGAGDAKEHYLDVDTPDLMHCTEFRTFWISWGAFLQVGNGPIPGEQRFMNWERRPETRHEIRFISFSTGYGNTGIWKLQENQGHYFIASTPDDMKYQYVWKTAEYRNNYISFRVRACNDVHVNLTPLESTVYYEVIIGGWQNTRSAIRWVGWQNERTEYLETGILNCDQLMPFWIQWEGGSIQVGKGTELGLDMFMMANDTEFAGVNHIAVTAGYGSDGLWYFDDDLENVYVYEAYTEDSIYPDYRIFTTTARQEYVVVEAQSCTDVWLGLSAFPEEIDMEFAHQVYIGAQNNTRTGVCVGCRVGPPIVEVSSIGVLSCGNVRTFWISWFNGSTATLGSGALIGVSPILSWDISSLGRVRTVGFAITQHYGGYFVARRNIGDSMVLHSGPDLRYHQLWASVRQDVIFRFRVRACHSVHLFLTGVLAAVRELQLYEAIIGQCYLTVVRDGISGPPVAQADTTDATSCFEYRSFWISWLDGYIRIGRGHRYKWNQILMVAERKPHPINAISLSTNNGVSGYWEIDADNGDYLVLETLYGDTSKKWFHLHSYTRWFYFQVAGITAHLVLGSRYQDPADVYNIYIGNNMNTECSLWKGTTLLQRKYQPDLLNRLNLRDFWVSWENGQILLGQSRHRDIAVLLNYTDKSDPFTITAMALAGDREGFAEWRIWENIAIEMSMWTQSFQSYDQAWWSVRHRSSIYFALQSCGQVEIILSAVMHEALAQEYTYTVTMNDDRNMTGIWRGNRVQKLSEVFIPDIVSCSTEQFYWLSWYDGHIALGRGNVRGTKTIIAYQDLSAVPITAIAFSTLRTNGAWRMPLSVDNFIVIPPRRNIGSMTAGETGGVVIGALILIVVFVVLVGLVIVPSRMSEIGARIRIAVSRGTGAGEGSSQSFDNPASSNVFNEVHLS